MSVPPTLVRAALVADGASVHEAPGALLVAQDRIIAVGGPQQIGQPSGVRIVDLPDCALVPALVNCHAHLDLSHLGPVPFANDFAGWIEMVRTGRADDDDGITTAVHRGVDLSLAGGTGVVGDIAGAVSHVPIRVLRAGPLAGVSFLEVFGVGRRQDRAIEAMEQAVREIRDVDAGVRLGLQPHAPFSCGPRVYHAATRFGVPLATHLAESPEETEYIRHGAGPIADMLRRLGVDDETIATGAGHPVDACAEALAVRPFLVAHANYIDDAHIPMFRAWRTSVAYCPRASAYFGHPNGAPHEHPYRRLLDAGVNVALGTDSIICLDTPDRISVLDEMRLLLGRDGLDGRLLLRMATVNGAMALDLDVDLVTLAPGPTAGVIALPVDRDRPTLDEALAGTPAPQWIVGPIGDRQPPTTPDDPRRRADR